MSAGQTQQKRERLATLRINRDESRRPSWLWRLTKWTLVLGILAGLGYGGYLFAIQRGLVQDVTESVPEAIRPLPEVRVSRVVVEHGRAADALVVATGYLESRRQAMIGSRAAGRIEAVNVEEGSRVSTGEIMAILEHKDVDAALAAGQATLSRAQAELEEQEVEIARTKNDLERAVKLRAQKSNTEADLDTARFAHEAAVARRRSLNAAIALAEARVRETEQIKENMIIRAPFDGTVISKDAEVGESILPGGMGEASGRGSVVTIADLDHLEVDCDVKEDYIGRVVEGGPAEVLVDAVPDRRYEGRVRKIIPMGDRARATIKVKVEVVNADKRLFPEMSATVYFLPEQDELAEASDAPRVFCDADAVRYDEQGSFVWIVGDENRVGRVDVTAGDSRDGRTEISAGLTGDERVIVGNPAGVEVNKQVKVRE